MNPSFTDAQLAAFLDGTLDDDSLIDAIEAAINADPALAQRAEALAGDDLAAAAVRDAFARVLVAPVPDHLTRIVAAPDAGAPVDLATARAAKASSPPSLPMPANDTGSSWRWPQFGAMAASLALGVLIGGPLLTGGASGDTAGSAGLVLANADLDTMLNTAPSGQAVDLASLGTGEVVLTFRSTGGQLCRQFTLEGGNDISDALACAQPSGSWRVEAFGRRADPAGEMKLAGGDAAPAVVAAVDAIIDSDALTGADELAELGKK